MSAKKRRQTMEKVRREQRVKQRRADKLQKKQDARLARAAGALPGEAGIERDTATGSPIPLTELPETGDAATVQAT